ncbi:MAG: [Fe-S]-binding protein, partial [Deltaproteobacteria bacterium]|nr:[Fe-S]-binding protein [Deltaproteobacteria bacterium]
MSEINTPWVQTITLDPPTLQDNTADADRLISALKANLKTAAIDIDLDLLKRLPDLLRQWKYQ